MNAELTGQPDVRLYLGGQIFCENFLPKSLQCSAFRRQYRACRRALHTCQQNMPTKQCPNNDGRCPPTKHAFSFIII